MEIKSNSKIKRPVSAVSGRVCLEVVDPLTGKVIDRIERKNHIFADSFQCAFWQAFLDNRTGATNTRGQLFLTNDSTPATDDIPYQRGDIIGWGFVGSPATGLFQGAWNSAESILGEPLSGGAGVRYKHVYGFMDNQVPETVGSISFTPQYRPFFTYGQQPFGLRPLRERRLRSWQGANTNSVTRKNMRYWLTQASTANNAAVTVFRMNMLTGETTQVDVTPFTSTAPSGEQNRNVGVAFDSDSVFISITSGTAGIRRVLEFSDDSFTTLAATHLTPNHTIDELARPFAVLGGVGYTFSASGINVMYFAQNLAPLSVAMRPCVYNTGVVTAVRSITVRNGVLYIVSGNNSIGSRTGFWDISGSTPVQLGTLGDIAIPFSGGTNVFAGIMTEPSLDNRMILAAATSNQLLAAGTNTLDFWTQQALTSFSISSGSYTRPPGNALKIAYTMDVMF